MIRDVANPFAVLAAARSHGFTKVSSLLVLYKLRDAQSPSTTHDLAGAAGITVPGIHLIIDDFHESKMVTRSKHRFTGKLQIRITPLGRTIANRIQRGAKS